MKSLKSDKKGVSKTEDPEIYAIKKTGILNKFERRDFIKVLSVLTGSTIVGCGDNVRKSGIKESVPVLDERKFESETVKAESCNDLIAHSGGINSLAINHDGKMLASGGSDYTLKLWSVIDGKLVKTFKGHSSDVYSVSFSPDGKTLVSGSSDNSIKLWSISDGKLISTLEGHSAGVSSVSFAPDGKTLASGSADGSVNLWSIPEGKLIKTLEGQSAGVSSVSFSPDGKILVSGGSAGFIKVWSIPEGVVMSTLGDNYTTINSLSFSVDGKTLASGDDAGSIKLWSISEGIVIKSIEGDYNAIRSLSFSPDGKILASGSADETIKLWAMPAGVPMKTLEGHTGAVNSVAFSSDGKTLASGGQDKTIKLWTWSTFADIEPDTSYEEFFGEVTSLACIGDNYIVARRYGENKLEIFNTQENRISNLFSFRYSNKKSVLLTNDHKFLIFGEDKGIIRWYNLENTKIKGKIVAHETEINDILITGDNSILVTTGNDNKVRFWSFPNGLLLKELDGLKVTLSFDSKSYALLLPDNFVSVGSISDFAQIKIIRIEEKINNIALSPLTNKLIAGTDKDCIIYDYEKDKVISRFSSEYPVVNFSVNKDEKYIVFTYEGPDLNGFSVADLGTKKILANISFTEYSSLNLKLLVKYLDDGRIIYINSKIRIYSFSDFKEDIILSNCLYDKKELTEGLEGITYKVGGQTMTLPCGSSIPSGYVCTCNCVRVGNPVSYTYYSSPSYYYVTYWYPN
jgi:WD40 repeat protein